MDQSQARRRRRDGSSGVQQRLCTHCGRSFKRSEHLERHVRTRSLPQPQLFACVNTMPLNEWTGWTGWNRLIDPSLIPSYILHPLDPSSICTTLLHQFCDIVIILLSVLRIDIVSITRKKTYANSREQTQKRNHMYAIVGRRIHVETS